MPDGRFIAFLGVALLLTITPGADMALVTKHALGCGRRAALQAAGGIITGLVVWAGLSAAGLAALLAASATAFTIVKFLGGAYLIYLGAQTLWETRHRGGEASAQPAMLPAERVTGRRAYVQGLLSNLLNPKVGVFYTTLLPQFVVQDRPAVPQLLLLAVTHLLTGVVWLVWYVQIVVKAGEWLRRPRVRRWLDRATGAVLVGLGLRLATERR